MTTRRRSRICISSIEENNTSHKKNSSEQKETPDKTSQEQGTVTKTLQERETISKTSQEQGTVTKTLQERETISKTLQQQETLEQKEIPDKTLQQQETSFSSWEYKSISGEPIVISYDFFNDLLTQLNEFVQEITNIPLSEDYILVLQDKKKIITSFLQQIPTLLFGYTDQLVYKVNHRIVWIFDRWPHQNWVQAILGEIFFPNEFRQAIDYIPALYERAHIRYRLTISASFHNPMAYYHLIKILERYISPVNTFTTRIKHITKKLKTQVKKFFIKGMEGNAYVKAISAKNAFSEAEYKQAVDTAVLERKEYRLVPDFTFLNSQKDLISLYLDALKCGHTTVLFYLAGENWCLGKKVVWLLYSAQKENLSFAYHELSILLQKYGSAKIRYEIQHIDNPTLIAVRNVLDTEFKDSDIISFLDKAGDLGMATALREKGLLIKQKEDSDQMEAIYIQAAFTLNDEYSWYLLSRLYSKKGDFEQAQDCLIKAGLYTIKELDNIPNTEQLIYSIHEHLNKLELLIQDVS